MTDPVSDFLTRLRNASKAGLTQCVAPHSKLKEGIAAILKNEGYIANYAEGKDDKGHKTIVIDMKYINNTPCLTKIIRVSTPGRRIYHSSTGIPRVLNGLGISILSTSKGLLKDADARREKVGGEIICQVW